MYNKCDVCGRQIGNFEERKLLLDSRGKVSTRCMDCFEDYQRVRKKS